MAHDAEGIDGALARLARLGPPEQVLVAIEARKGLVVDRLMAGGFGVVPIHPNSFNAARPRWGASRSKSDPGDSYKLADYVRTDSHRLAQMGQLDRPTADLQALCRVRDDHVEAKVAAMNPHCCFDRLGVARGPSFRWPDFFSDDFGEFFECFDQTDMWRGFGSEFVVAAADVLNQGVASYDG